jgi:hypothetical protein
VYHATSAQNVLGIIDGGLQPVENAWGGGQLGPGFYTATTAAGAEAYMPPGGATLVFTTNAPTHGPTVWDFFNPPGAPPEGHALYNEDFFTVVGDTNPISQIKWNHGAYSKLTLTGVIAPNVGTMTPQAYEDLVYGN